MDRFSRDQILAALAALAGELREEPRQRELILAGGAAMVLLYGARESTRDVDAVVAERETLRAARRAAVHAGLPEDWLNDAAKGYLHGLAVGPTVFETPTLVVRVLAPHQLLAMKLCAWRDDLDIEDARVLLRSSGADREGVWRIVEPHLVPGRELKAKYAFDDLWEAEHGPA